MTDLEKEFEKFKKEMQERISTLESKLDEVQTVVDDIERDIYLDEDLEEQVDTINCPYCNYEVAIDYDENLKEIQCPECNNTIELDWSGDIDEENYGCGGNCSSCGGCGNDNEEK